jgi:maleate isomerase
MAQRKLMSESDLMVRMHSAEGWRAEVGMLAPLPGMYREWEVLVPEGIRFSEACLGLVQCTAEDLMKMNEDIEVETKKLTLCRKPDLICLGCTSGSFVGGPNYDKEIIERIENVAETPATTTTTCVLDVFKDMGITKIALVGPYPQAVFDIEVEFFKNHGVESVYVKGLNNLTMPQMWGYYTDPYACYHLVKNAAKVSPDADCVFVTCMMTWLLSVADILEEEIGLPVISSPSATLYGILKKLEIPDPVYHYGEALRRPRLSR